MFRLSLSHLQALMIQIHTKKVLCTVGSPTLTIYRYCKCSGSHNAQYFLCMDPYHAGLKMTVAIKTCTPVITLYVLYVLLLCLTDTFCPLKTIQTYKECSISPTTALQTILCSNKILSARCRMALIQVFV